ncbi:MAG: NTF2 fold immunity protein [Syntrophothermus sp.]
MYNRVIAIAAILFTLFLNGLYGQKRVRKDEFLHNLYKDNLHEVLKHKRNGYKPGNGVVPDSISAIRIAEIILPKVYGVEQIKNEKPFTALLIEGYWIVYGFLPEGSKGGVAEIYIKKSNGEVIYISHGE